MATKSKKRKFADGGMSSGAIANRGTQGSMPTVNRPAPIAKPPVTYAPGTMAPPSGLRAAPGANPGIRPMGAPASWKKGGAAKKSSCGMFRGGKVDGCIKKGHTKGKFV